jgi:hypothetical protein
MVEVKVASKEYRAYKSSAFFVSSSDLLTNIKGGNRQQGYDADLILEGETKDIDILVENDDPK